MPAPPDPIDLAVQRLRAGGLVAFPTETVYGLGADALNPVAVARVFAVKGRPAVNPLIVHVADEGMARQVAAEWPDEAHALAGAFWPGPLSIIVPKSPSLPALVTAGGMGVGVRCPDHPLTLELLRRFARPLVGPSANPSGRVSPTTAEHVRAVFSPDLVLVLDGGPCRGGIESTVVSLIGTPRILRPGLVTKAQIERVLGRSVESGGAPASGAFESPGQMESHYAPRTPAVRYQAGELARVLASVPRVAVLARSALAARPPHMAIPMPGDAPTYARMLYAALRQADAAGVDLIAIEEPPTDADPAERALWEAIADRLRRAAKPLA